MVDRDVVVLTELPQLGRLFAQAVLTRRAGRGDLPRRSVVLLDHEQDAARLAAYARVCGFPLTNAVPPTWLHVLTFPLQAALMAEADFPFPLAGLVHLANDMTLHRPVLLGDRLRLQVTADALADHHRGAQFDLVGEVYVGDQLAWSGRSTYLARGEGRGERAPREDQAPLPAASQQWRLAADLGRRYAAVSGDVNPIHLHPWAAKALGFPRTVAHGMWTHARALAALGGRLPATYGVGVRFAKPLLLPSTVAYRAERTASGWTLWVTNGDGSKVHLAGEVRA